MGWELPPGSAEPWTPECCPEREAGGRAELGGSKRQKGWKGHPWEPRGLKAAP